MVPHMLLVGPTLCRCSFKAVVGPPFGASREENQRCAMPPSLPHRVGAPGGPHRAPAEILNMLCLISQAT